jgi:hypothetical protein
MQEKQDKADKELAKLQKQIANKQSASGSTPASATRSSTRSARSSEKRKSSSSMTMNLSNLKSSCKHLNVDVEEDEPATPLKPRWGGPFTNAMVMLSKPGDRARFTTMITNHPDWKAEMDENLKDFGGRKKDTRSQDKPGVLSVMEVADKCMIKHSGMSKKRMVEAVAYCISRDSLCTSESDLFERYHDNKSIIPQFKDAEQHSANGRGKPRSKRQKTHGSA